LGDISLGLMDFQIYIGGSKCGNCLCSGPELKKGGNSVALDWEGYHGVFDQH
jgi:hypothetical protein